MSLDGWGCGSRQCIIQACVANPVWHMLEGQIAGFEINGVQAERREVAMQQNIHTASENDGAYVARNVAFNAAYLCISAADGGVVSPLKPVDSPNAGVACLGHASGVT